MVVAHDSFGRPIRIWEVGPFLQHQSEFSMPPIDWAAIITAIIQAIKDCQNPTPAGLRRPGLLGTFRKERAVREGSKLSRPEWRKHRDEIMQQVDADLAQATDADLQALIDEAKAA